MHEEAGSSVNRDELTVIQFLLLLRTMQHPDYKIAAPHKGGHAKNGRDLCDYAVVFEADERPPNWRRCNDGVEQAWRAPCWVEDRSRKRTKIEALQDIAGNIINRRSKETLKQQTYFSCFNSRLRNISSRMPGGRTGCTTGMSWRVAQCVPS